MATQGIVERSSTLVWAGRIMAFLAVAHLGLLGVDRARYLSGWLTGGLWQLPGPGSDLSQSAAAFWLVVGSFAAPVLVLGLLVSWIGRAGGRVPGLVGWGLGAWALAGTLVLEPSPFVLGLVPAAMIVLASRRASNRRPGGAT